MRPTKKHRPVVRKGVKAKQKSKTIRKNIVKSKEKTSDEEIQSIETLTTPAEYRSFIAQVCNKALNDQSKCQIYTEPLFGIAHSKGGGDSETKTSAANLAIKSIALLLSRFSISGLDEESKRGIEVLEAFTRILERKFGNNPTLVGFLIPKLIAADTKAANDALLTLSLKCCNKNTYKKCSETVANIIEENLQLIKDIFQFGSLGDSARIIKLITKLKETAHNPKLISLFPLINLREREFSSNAYFKFQFHKVNEDLKNKLKYAAVEETPDVVNMHKKTILEHVLALYMKILEDERTRSCELLISCFKGLAFFSQFLNSDLQNDILKQMVKFQNNRKLCPLVFLIALDSAMKIIKFQNTAIKIDVSWIVKGLADKLDLTDVLLLTNYTNSNKSNPCKDKIIKTIANVLNHLYYLIDPYSDLQYVTQLVSKLLSHALFSEPKIARQVTTIIFDLVKKFRGLKDIFEQEGVLVSNMGKWESCYWELIVYNCHYSPKIRENVQNHLKQLKSYKHTSSTN